MSDSDDDIFTNNPFTTFQNENTILSARGPNINVNNLTGFGFRNNMLSSTMQMPGNFEKQRCGQSNYDQQRMHYRRETSPMSTMSACDVRQRNFYNSYYAQASSSQRSMFNGRSGSPVSVRSIDSTGSVSAADIATALKCMKFNKYDRKVIKEAYNKFIKSKVRKRFQKRRNIRLFLHGCKSGGESGEQGSDSSLSSDDRMSKTSNYKENMSSCRSTKTDITNFRRTIQESNIYTDCTNSLKHNTFHSMVGSVNNNTSISAARSMIAGSNMPSFRNIPRPANFNNMQRKPSVPVMSQKERFKSGFLLPSQRFNQSVASKSIPENAELLNHQNNQQSDKNAYINRNQTNNIEIDSDLDLDNIFTNPTKLKNNTEKKRYIDNDDMCLPSQKRTKITSPQNSVQVETNRHKETLVNNHQNDNTNDFVFAKPTFPVKRSTKDKLISASSSRANEQAIILNTQNGKDVEQEKDEQENDTLSTTDPSMRPSFIKRKLFTQKLDVSEKKNTEIDISASPINSIYSAIQKDKHKARKLQQVTTQSCLNRDVQDDSNLLDLIHKIVPREQINITNQTNKTDMQNSKNNSEENDRWDVTSIISERRNDDDVSDTYTDEEIFNATIKEVAKETAFKDCVKKNTPKKQTTEKKYCKEDVKQTCKIKQKKEVTPKRMCNVLIERLTDNVHQLQKKDNGAAYNGIQKYVKTFWDTDFDSDAECELTSRNCEINLRSCRNGTLDLQEAPKPQGLAGKFNSKKIDTISTGNATSLNYTTDNVKTLNKTRIGIRSHRSNTRKNIDLPQFEDMKSVFEPQSKEQKTLASSCKEIGETGQKAKNVLQNKKTIPTKQLSLPKTNVNINNTSVDSVKKTTPKRRTKSNTKQQKQATDIIDISPKLVKKRTPKKPNDNSKKLEKDHLPAKSVKNVKQAQEDTEKNTTKSKQNKNKTSAQNLNKKQKSSVIEDTAKNSNNMSKLKQTQKTIKHRAQNKKQTQNTSCTKEDISTEDNNNNSSRILRSCRALKLNDTGQSNTTLNASLNRTLRSRQIDLSSLANGHVTKVKQIVKKTIDAKSRLSDVSFSITANKNSVAKKAVKQISHLLEKKKIESSDISFSLTTFESSTPKKAKVSRSGVNSKTNDKSRQSTFQSKEILLSKYDKKSIRNRIPNKKYQYVN